MKKWYVTLIASVAVLTVTAMLWAGRPLSSTALAASGSIRMPMVMNWRIAGAEARLRLVAPSATYSTRYVDFPARVGTVVAQIPEVGAVLKPRAHITLIASNGVAPRYRPPKFSPAYFTDTGIYYQATPDGCGGTNCSSTISVEAWPDTNAKPDVLGVSEIDNCAFAWDQLGDTSTDFQGNWYAQTVISIPDNGCFGNDSWRLSFSKN